MFDIIPFCYYVSLCIITSTDRVENEQVTAVILYLCRVVDIRVVFMSGGITYDGHISKPGITELKVGSSENWYSRVR